MKNLPVFKNILFVFFIIISQYSYAQLADGFDIKKVYEELKSKGFEGKRLDEYVNHEHALYLSKKNATIHKHSNEVKDLGIIYKNYNDNSAVFKPTNPNSPQNIYCPNAGFEQFNFGNWLGETGTVSTGATGAPFPIYTQTATGIVNPAGNNTSIVNTSNFHTIMTTPATNSVYPNCVGYDSIAVKVVGTQTVSGIPVVNPNGGPASVRMNCVNSFNESIASKLTYNMSLNPNNKNFTISYALVLNGSGFHTNAEQPYFSVKVTDQNGNLVPGCSQYAVTVNSLVTTPGSPSYDPLFEQSALLNSGDPIYYRPWTTYAFDFTNYPAITSVSVEFYVGGCSGGAHFGYAYVDAECGLGGAVASFCAGSNTTILNAPNGYSTYQWVGPSGAVSVANGGNTGTATITPVTAGQVFTCNVTAPNGCSSVFQTTVSVTTISITGVNSTPSCPNGNSGSTSVAATGSSSGYSYQWLNSLGATVGNTQSVSGLSPGTYSVVVSSPLCGVATTTVNVGIAPPSFYSLPAPYCGSVAWITNAGGSNYKWYTASPLALISGATSSSLTINSPVNGADYFLVYTTASGCKDSIKYTLSQQTGGSIYVSNVKSICPGNSNSYAVINLQTSAPPLYSYTVTGPSGYSSILTNTTALKDSITGLSIGTYSAIVFDGQCIYNTTFSVSPFAYTYTLTPTTSTICSSGSTSLAVNFGNNVSSTCGLDPSVCLTGSPTNLFSGPFTQNGSTSYPTPYGNWYTYGRTQFLLRQSDLNAAGINAGKISSLAFNVLNMNTSISSYPNFYIKMGCTGLASLPDVTTIGAQPFIAGLQTVYSNANQPVALGWVTHNFSQAYVWDGVSNIIIEVCFGMNTSSNYTQNVSIELKQLPYVASMYHVEDTNPVCSGTQSADNFSGSLVTNGQYMVPNMKLGYCGGQNPAAFTYSWSPSTGLSSTTSYTSIANPTVTTVYTVQVNPIGQTNCMQAQTSTITIVNPASPTITAVNPMCTNASAVTLTVTPVGGGWTGPGISATGVLTPSLATAGLNTYTYSIGSGTCSANNTTTISIEQFVPSTITGAIIPLCVTNPTVALPTTASPTGTWTGTGVAGTSFNPAIAGAGTHTLTYHTNSNPTATLCPSSSTLAVVVSSATQPTITSAGPYCDNSGVQPMSANPLGGVWSAATVGTSITSGGLFATGASLIGSNKIYYTVTTAPCVKVDSLLIDVVHFVPATITGTVGPYCIYDAMENLQAIAQNTGGVWSGAGVTGSDFTPALAGAGTHTVTYSTNPSPLIYCGTTETIAVLVNPKPEANAVPDFNNGCNPVLVNYSSPNVFSGNATWDFGDGSPKENGLNVSHLYTVPGTYTATMTYTDNVGCLDTSMASSPITVYANPVASFDPSVTETTVVDGQVEFTNESTVLGNNTYAWDIGGLYTSTQTHESYLFTTSGNYTITLVATSDHNCVDDTSIVVVVNPDVVLYVPNAFTPGNNDGLNDEFQIFLPPTGVDFSTFSLLIYDRWGELIYKTTDVNKFWNGAKNNSGDVLKQDVYVYKITFKDEKKKKYEKVGHVSLLHK